MIKGKTRNSSGITLIALVLTIIVLLILAGVSIAMLAGDNSILNRATQAKTNTGLKQIDEKIKLANVAAITRGQGTLDYDVLKEELAKVLGTEGEDWTISAEDTNPWVVTVDGNEYPLSEREKTGGQQGGGEENPTQLTINLTISGESVDTVPIPTGFYHVGGTKDTGFIISDSQADENKGTSHEIAQTLVGNQFVWVPVDKNQKLKLEVKGPEEITAIKLKDPFGDEVNLGTVNGTTYTNANIEPTVNGLYYVEATAGSETKTATLVVRSLYAQDTFNDYYSTEDGIKAFMEMTNSATKADLIQMLKSRHLVTSENPTDIEIGWAYTSVYKGCTKTNDYKEESVNEKGGFYVGRYEAGNASGTLVSKANTDSYVNVKRSQASDLADGMYTGKSHLLTGAAWDRILGWIITTNNKTIAQVIGDSKEWGNYSNDEFSNTTEKVKTGIFSQTNAMSIYDLAGNVVELTSEISPDQSRPCFFRGGYYFHTGSTSPAISRGADYEDVSSGGIGFRVALFL